MPPAIDSRSARLSQARALFIAILIMLGIAGGTGWLFARGLARGETWFPSRRVSSSRVVDRIQEPVMFWTATALYGVLCGSATGFAMWLAREGLSAPDGVFRRRGRRDEWDGPDSDQSCRNPIQGKNPSLDEARAWVAQISPAETRAAAGRLLAEAVALPSLSPGERTAAFLRIRQWESVVPDYQLRSFGASVLELVGDSIGDSVVRKEMYAEALELARWYASGATSGGEGAARSMHAREIETRLRALEAGSRVANSGAAKPSTASALPSPALLSGATSAPPVLPPARRPKLVTTVGWLFIVAGALITPVSFISALMILSGGDGSSGGTFLGGLIVIGGPPLTLISGIGLLRRQPWAYGYALAVLGLLATYSAAQIFHGSTPERSTVSPSGVINTVLASSPDYPLHFLTIAISVSLLVTLLSPAIRTAFVRRSE